jgi:hypothetical protein
MNMLSIVAASRAWALFFCLIACCATGTVARPEFVISAFGGVALTENNDLRLQQGGGTDLTFPTTTASKACPITASTPALPGDFEL